MPHIGLVTEDTTVSNKCPFSQGACERNFRAGDGETTQIVNKEICKILCKIINVKEKYKAKNGNKKFDGETEAYYII